MAVESEEVCRFCLKSLANSSFEIIENIKLGMLDVLLLKLNFTVSIAPLVCSTCVECLKLAFDFKTTCLSVEEKINNFVSASGNLNVDLKEVYLAQRHPKKRRRAMEEDHRVCRFCLKSSKACLLNDVTADSALDMLQKYCPELDTKVTRETFACEDCTNGLTNTLDFITRCLETENYIRKYYEVEEIPSSEQISLHLVSQFVAILKSIDPDSDEYYDSIMQGYDGESQPSTAGFSENASTQQHLSNDSSEQMVANILTTSEAAQRTSTKKRKKRTRPKPPGSTEAHAAPPLSHSPPLVYKCPECPFESKYNSSYHKHALKHQTDKEPSVYECKLCDFKTKHTSSLKRHTSTRHRACYAQYKCEQCGFRTASQRKLSLHANIHAAQPESPTFACSRCPYKTISKRDLNKHEVSAHVGKRYSCDTCQYKTENWQELRSHKSGHRMVAAQRHFKCEVCSFTTRHRSNLLTHAVTHKSREETVMYKCLQCNFETKHKVSLRTHMLRHLSPQAVKFHECEVCGFKTRHKGNLKLHMVIHVDPSEAVMYKCDSCDFQTIHKMSLRTHKLRHMKRSEVVLYGCDVCEFETPLKGNLKKHQLIHKEASEVKKYSCDLCTFETIDGELFKKHAAGLHPKTEGEPAAWMGIKEEKI